MLQSRTPIRERSDLTEANEEAKIGYSKIELHYASDTPNSELQTPNARYLNADTPTADLFAPHRSPSTSRISYQPAGLPISQSAARNAPLAKVSRLDARWVNSIRSPTPAK